VWSGHSCPPPLILTIKPAISKAVFTIWGAPFLASFARSGAFDVHRSQTTCPSPAYASPMPWGLKRFYGAGDLHFITGSCYHRQSFLGSA
jgi:hypothetical protein